MCCRYLVFGLLASKVKYLLSVLVAEPQPSQMSPFLSIAWAEKKKIMYMISVYYNRAIYHYDKNKDTTDS